MREPSEPDEGQAHVHPFPNHSDILIVGGGLAGLFCALKLAPRPVTIITAAPLGDGASSAWAQGGIAAAVAEGDTPEAHARDTIAAGAGLVDEAVALAMVREAPERIRDLLAYGVPFDKDLEGRLAVDLRSRAFGAAHRARERRSGRARHHGGAGRGRAQHAEHPRARRLCRRGPDRRWRPRDRRSACAAPMAGSSPCRRARSCSRPAASGISTR